MKQAYQEAMADCAFDRNTVQDMLDFIADSPVSYFAVRNVRNILVSAGFTDLDGAGDTGKLLPGGSYFLTRNGSSLIAFRLPPAGLKPRALRLAAAHSDSPCLKIRDHAELDGLYVRLESERYGGMINASWVDRPLSVAGRVLIRREGDTILPSQEVECRLVDMKKDMAVIPNLAIHMNRAMNDSVKYDPARDLVALYGEAASRDSFYRELVPDAERQDILGSDLYLYNNQPGTIWGPQEEFVSSPRLDDLACVFACTKAFLEAKAPADIVPVLCVFDNEEIGSGTRQGAASDFLSAVMDLISEATGLSRREKLRLQDSGLMLSCDNGHAKHPNHPEAADTNEFPVLNGGVVIKHSPRYATDGVSAAALCAVLDKEHIPYQHYSNRPDIAGGGTLGLIAATKTPVPTVDIGLAQLAMHSAFETMGSRDAGSFVKAVKAVYESPFELDNAGCIRNL